MAPYRPIKWTRERAIAILTIKPRGWRNVKVSGATVGQIPWAKVEPRYRAQAQAKFDELCSRWHRDHPDQEMSRGKWLSLRANATYYGTHVLTHKFQGHYGRLAQMRQSARAYLKSLETEEFRNQPLTKRVKRLL